MNFIDDHGMQRNKKGHLVCGDYFVCERSEKGVVAILCDGVGSGVYANISAINCASRILEMYRNGMSIRLASEKVAASMYRARREDVPFSAFTAAVVQPGGQFRVYSYESPSPILISKDYHATVLSPRFYTVGFEVIAEVSGFLGLGDSLLMFSDGVSQAGMGHGHSFGIGSEGVAEHINKNYGIASDIGKLPGKLMFMCKNLGKGFYDDDTTIEILHCRKAKELTLLTGPPSKQSMDNAYVTDFMNKPGKKVACGSTTIEIISRELGREAKILSLGTSFGMPPEYQIEGIDVVTEGAITLNQVFNILDEPAERLDDDSVVERLALMLHEADVINLMIGNAQNQAHEDLIFKQIGVHVRKATVQRIAERMTALGKLVVKKYY